jgi:enamine deaminase RidA (YjgF/YER057c/UK114 family)
MERQMTKSPHEIVNPESLYSPRGFAHAVVAAPGRTVYLGGQIGVRADGSLPDDLVEQFDQACSNLVEALSAAGGEPEHLVSLQIFATDVGEYAARMEEIGEAYRKHFGKHYPAMALLATFELFEPGAHVELVGTAVVT